MFKEKSKHFKPHHIMIKTVNQYCLKESLNLLKNRLNENQIEFLSDQIRKSMLNIS